MKSLTMQIIPGEGGKDSLLFANDLASMYVKYARKNSLTACIKSKSNRGVELSLAGNNCDKFV